MAMNLIDTHPNTYEIAAEIGKGAYGTVYKARDMKNNGQFVAIKEIRILSRSEEGMPMSTIREIGMLRQLEKYEHPNIVRLLDVCPGRQTLHDMKLMLVFEHMDQDLAQYLEKCPSCGLGPDCIRDLMQQIVKGVEFLHTNRIVHRDLKPQNILVTRHGRVKIADFGLARIYAFSMALTSVVVTLYYRSPEVLLQDTYCTAVDIWSCGTIFAELFLRRPLFQGTSELDQLCKIFHIMGLPSNREWPHNVSLPRSSFKDKPKQALEKYIPNIEPAARDILEKMLMFDQKKRISAALCLKHHYFTEEDPDVSMSSLSSSSSISHDTSSSSSSFSLDTMDPLHDLLPKPDLTTTASTTVSAEALTSHNTTSELSLNVGHMSGRPAAHRDPDVIPSSVNYTASNTSVIRPTDGQPISISPPDLICSTNHHSFTQVRLQTGATKSPAACPGDRETRPHPQNSPEQEQPSNFCVRDTTNSVPDFLPINTNPAPDFLPITTDTTNYRDFSNGYPNNDGDSPAKRGIKRSRPF